MILMNKTTGSRKNFRLLFCITIITTMIVRICRSYHCSIRPIRNLFSLRMATDSRELRFYKKDLVVLNSGMDCTTSNGQFSTWCNDKIQKSIQETVKAEEKVVKEEEEVVKEEEEISTGFQRRSRNSYQLDLSREEEELFDLLREVVQESKLKSTLRVAGGWVRDKLLATDEFQRNKDLVGHKTIRLTSKSKSHILSTSARYQQKGSKIPARGIQDEHQPVDIDIALDDMLGREFADHLNSFLSERGRKTASVGVVLKNPEKSKHLETATMKVSSFWIDFVNLRAEEYTQDSRIPDLMRIGTASEDASRRDLTINTLYYNINTDEVEDFTGRGLEDLKRCVISTPLAPLTTFLDDPLRVLRAIRFAARLRFSMDDRLIAAATTATVREALAHKVSRERIGGEIDLMLRSPDPVGAMRHLVNLNLVTTVFPIEKVLPKQYPGGIHLFTNGVQNLMFAFDYLSENKNYPPVWCTASVPQATYGFIERNLLNDNEARRLLWYAAYLKPLADYASLLEETKPHPSRGKKQNRSAVTKLLVDHLKRPIRDAESVEKIFKAADDFTQLIMSGCDISAQSIILSDIHVCPLTTMDEPLGLSCKMGGKIITSETEKDPLWGHAMEFRLLTSKIMYRVGPLWRAAIVLSMVEQLKSLSDEFAFTYPIEGDVYELIQEERLKHLIQQYDTFAVALQRLGLIGIWSRKPLMDGREIKKILPNIPMGPIFREVMDEQDSWMTINPNGDKTSFITHLRTVFTDFT